MDDVRKEAVGGAGLTREARALTSRTLEALRPAASPYRVPDTRCKGLAVRVSASGKITFDLAFRIKGGTWRRLSLGSFPDRSLEEARTRANELTRAARSGRDLIAEEEQARARAIGRITVNGLIDAYVKDARVAKLKTFREIERRLRRSLASLLEKPAEEVRRRDLRELFDEVAASGIGREAEKRRQTVGAMFRWAIAKDFIDADPTSGLPAYDGGEPRERVLGQDEIRGVWAYFDSGAMPEAHATVMKLELLIGARCGEIAGICVAEIDRDAWLWTLPGERSKNGKPRVTPIVGLAREIISSRISPATKHLFLSAEGAPLRSGHVGTVLYNHRTKIGVRHFATHDLRRTVATSMDEDLHISEETIASVIGHEAMAARATKTLRRHYLHGDKIERKRIALEAWDTHLRTVLFGSGKCNVVPIARAQN